MEFHQNSTVIPDVYLWNASGIPLEYCFKIPAFFFEGNDSNLGIEQLSRPCTNQNSIHPPQRNGDVLSDRGELVGGLSTSVEFLFGECGDWGSTKFKKCNSSKCILANSFCKPTDKIVSSVTHRTW